MSSLPQICLGLVAMAAVVFIPFAGAFGDSQADTRSYLTIAVEKQQIEIALGQLAAQRAENDRVKEFGARMVKDHKKVSHEVEQLASAHRLELPSQLNSEHRQKVEELSQLTGHAFDRAYLNYSLRNHEATLEEFKEHLKTINYPDIRELFTSTLPVLEDHHEKARVVKSSLQTNP